MRNNLHKLLLCLLLSAPLHVAMAQSVDFSKEKALPKNMIKTAPLKYIGFVNPEIAFSYERKLDSMFAIQATAGIMAPTVGFDLEADPLYYRGLKFALEPKFFLERIEAHTGYISVEADYRHKKSFVREEYATFFGTGLDTFRIRKQIINLSFKFGYQWILNGFVIDFYTGIGIRLRNSVATEKDPLNQGGFFEDFFNTPYSEGYQTTLHFPLNVRIGYAF